MGVKLLNFDDVLDAIPVLTPDKLATETVEVFFDKELVKLRFTELDSRDWEACRIAYPPRPGVSLDAAFGYDVTAASERGAQKNGELVDGDESAKVTPEQWAKVFAPGRLDSQGRQAITNAVFSLNERAHLARLEVAANLSLAGSKRKPRSPAK